MNISEVDLSKLSGWAKSGILSYPSLVTSECPHCSVTAVFPLSGFQDASTASMRSKCPACLRAVTFFFVLDADEDKGTRSPKAAFIFPAVRSKFASSVSQTDVPDPLFRAIETAIQSYNSGNFPATAVTGRRALEGIFKYLVAEEKRKKPLHQLIEEVKNATDLSAPLTKLSHAIRQGGNLGAHFDFEREPDEDMARTIIELLDYLVNYLYILPKRIEELEAKLG